MVKIKDLIPLQKIAASKRFQVISVTLLMLLASAGAYFTFYISNQSSYFNNSNFRQLNSLSEQVSTRVSDLKSGFRSSVEWTLKGGQPNFKKSLATISGINFTGVKPDGELSADARKALPSELPKDIPCTIDLHSRQGAALLEIKCATPAGEFRGTARFAELIAPFLDPDLATGHKQAEHDGGFDDILIAAVEDRTESSVHSGDVIFDQGTPELALTSLNDLKLANDPTGKLDFAAFSHTTNSDEVRLGGSDYKIYVEPLELSTGEQSSHWIICGLVESGHFRHQTWAVSYTVLIVLAFLTSLIPLSWPFLKILFIGPKDRLRRADVYFVTFSLVIGVAVITLFSLWVYTYTRKQKELDGQLAALSRSIAKKYDVELRQSLLQVDRLNARKVADDKAEAEKEKSEESSAPPPEPVSGDKTATKSVDDGKVIKADSSQKTKVLDGVCAGSPAEQIRCLNAEPFPFFNVIFWTDAKGNQLIKWLLDSNTTNPHPVNTRPYFTEIVNGHALDFEGQEFWIAPQASSVTGSKTVVLSKPIHPGQSDGVIAMATSLPSVMDAITPPGFGYRIIDSKGAVQLQSADSQQWKENFFVECNNDRLLRSTVAAHIEKDLTVSYKGRAHSLRVLPLKHSPDWSLVVLRDKQPLRTIYLEILTVAGALFLAYAFLLLLVFIAFYLIRTKKSQRNEWIWPSPEALGTYYRSIVLSVLFCALSILVILTTNGGWTVLLVSLIAFVGIAGFLLRLKLGWVFKAVNRVAQNIRLERSLDYSRAYIANLVMLVILIGIVPAVAFFKVAHQAETLLFIKDGQLKLAQRLMARQKRITDQYSNRKTADNPGPFSSEAVAKAFIDRRVRLTDDIYSDSFYETLVDQRTATADLSGAGVKNDSLDPVLRFFVSQVPFYNQTSAESWGRTANVSADNSWLWESDSTLVRLRAPQQAKAGDRIMYLTTSSRALDTDWNAWPLATALLVATFVFLIGLLSFLTRFIVRKVFLLDFEEHAFIQLTPDELTRWNQNLFVVTNGAAASSQALPRNGNFSWVDLSDDAVDARLKEIASGICEAMEPRPVVFERFDESVNDLSRGTNALGLIEQLLSVNGKVVILSGTDPTAYRWPEAKSNGSNGSNGAGHSANGLAIEDRWAEIAGQFMKVYSAESCCVDDFENVLSDKEKEFAADPSLTRSQKKKIQSSIDILRAECGPRLVLRRIGKGILRRQNFAHTRPAEVLNQIGTQARLYYNRIWQSLGEDEKLTLLHLAEDGLLSPNDPQIGPLLLKRLIVRSPDVRLLNQTFSDFVLRHCFTGTLASIESEAKQMSPWERLKLPLLIGLTGLVLFLVITQKEFFGSSLSLITGITSGIPAVFKLLSFLQSQGSGQKILNTASNQVTT